MSKLCVFDFDSTLSDAETIDEIAKAVGLGKDVAQITEQAMEGNLSFFQSLTQRVSLLKGLEYSKVEEICHSLPITNGAKECISGLKKSGYKVVVFSGGFKTATSYFRDKLGLDADFSNTLFENEGVLTGQVGGEMMFDFSKGEMIQKLQKLMGISKENTVVVGDGANDLSMFEHAETCIAFCAKAKLKEAATHIIDERDLQIVLDNLGISRE